jgi:hypothetical protein
LHATLQEVQRWSLEEYLPALAKAHALSAQQRTAIVERLSRGPEYDAAGNMTFDGVLYYAYDAWNRMVKVNKTTPDEDEYDGSLVAKYAYDGLGRRILKENLELSQSSPFRQHYYYDGQRCVEIRDASDLVLKQQVWGLQYIDELIQLAVNDDPSDQNEDVCESKYWACQDANFNVLGIVDDEGVLKEWYEYTPYGQRTVFLSAGDYDPKCYAPTYHSQRVVADSVTTGRVGKHPNPLKECKKRR